MKDKCYRLNRLLHKLRTIQETDKKYVIWSLNKEQLEYLQRYFDIEPYLYKVRTRRFVNIYKIKDTILKDIHYANKSGKKEIVRHLNSKDRKIMDKYDIKYKAYKYRICLNSK